MKFIKFKVTEDLKDFEVFKKDNFLIVKLLYKSGEEIIKLPFTGKIHHWKYSQVSGWGYVFFYYLNEVFGITEFEKKEIFKKEIRNKEELESPKSNNFNFDLSDTENYD